MFFTSPVLHKIQI